jgi:hypothetical protein
VIDGQCREPNRTLVTTPAPRCPTGEVYRDGACHGPERVRIDQGGPDRIRTDQGGGGTFGGGRPLSRQPECGRDEYLKDGRCVRR